jgi:nucleoside-diphosphate-sugar epimerase
MRVLVAGAGWLGSAVARALVARGDQGIALRRDPARAAALAAPGITPLALDLTSPDAASRLPEFDAVVACQSAGGDTAEAYRGAYVEANRTLLAAAARHGARKLVYTGSTGVFGQRNGDVVNEATPPAPASPSAEVLVEAERLVLWGSGGVPACLLRFSGLYGPGRAGVITRVREGRLCLGPGDDAFMNFCHLDDAVTFVLAALDRGEAGATYHGSDAAPTRRREVVTWIAGQLGVKPARSESPAGGPNRAIDSTRTRQLLGVTLRYRSFREGLAPLISAAR